MTAFQGDGKEGATVAWPARDELRILNTDILRVDGPDKLRGRARYTHDVRLPGMLWGRVLCSTVPAAKVTVDVEPALAIEGVAAAIALEDEVTYVGRPIAAVAAETPELADDAIRAIRVEYDEGEWAVDYERAVAEGAPRVTGKGNLRFKSTSGDRESAEAALEGCDAVVEATYTLPVQHHACLETHGVVVDFRGGDEATVYCSTQYTHGVSGEAARVLGLERSAVTTINHHMGGGFGSKFGLDVPGRIACELASRVERPVHLMFTRRDEFLAAGNRSGSRQTLRGGATKDGSFAALVSDVAKLGGLGRGSHPGQPYIYRVGTSFTESSSVLTNTDGSRAMRAPGHPQASFAIESMVDELAYAIGMDPLEFRKRNLEDPVYHRQLDRVAREIGWLEHPHRTAPPGVTLETTGELAVGIGFGVSTWNGGGRKSCEVEVRIERDGGVTSTVGSQDLGTGTRTYLAAVVAEELGLEVEQVTPRLGDSRFGGANPSGGSTTAASLAPAIEMAVLDARTKLFAHLAPLLETTPERLVARDGAVLDAQDGSRSMTWSEACGTLSELGIVGRGEWNEDLQAGGVHGAQAARVEVDTLTGEVRVRKMVCIQDVGLPLNRLALRSQINGAMIQALSFALFEERVIDPWLGTPLSAGFEDYRIATSGDIPELVAILDDDDPRHQVIGVGEPPVIPGQSAIANAVHNACGVRIRDLPLTRDKILNALAERG